MNSIQNNKYNYNDEERFKIFRKQYDSYNDGDKVRIVIDDNTETIGYISHIVDDSKGSGLQEYVITDNYVPINASYEERLGIKDVMILYRVNEIGKHLLFFLI